MKKLVIDRSKWRSGGDSATHPVPTCSVNGSGKGATALLNEEGYMCCLGFASLQLEGWTKEEIKFLGEPGEVARNKAIATGVETYPEYDEDSIPGDLIDDHLKDYLIKPIESEAIETNDDALITREVRESKIKDIFKKINVDVEFTGEYENAN